MSSTVPSFTEYTSLLAAQSLARGSTQRGTIDLRSKFGAYLYCRMARGGTVAITNGVAVGIRKYVNDGTNDIPHPSDYAPLLSGTAAASGTTVNTDSNSGQPALNVASITGFAAGDYIAVFDATWTRLEFHKVSKTATGILTLDRNLIFTHTAAQADIVRNKADVFAPIWLEGGARYEVIFDYGDDAAGDAAIIQAFYSTYDNDTTTG